MPTYSAYAPQRASEPFRPWLELCFRGHRHAVLCAEVQCGGGGGGAGEVSSCMKRHGNSSGNKRDAAIDAQSSSSRARRRVSAASAAPRVVSCGADGAVMLWDANPTTRALRLLGHRGAVLGCAFSPLQQPQLQLQSSYYYSYNDNDDAAAGDDGDNYSAACAASSSSSSLLLASCGQDGYVRLWVPTLRASPGLYPAHGSHQVDCTWTTAATAADGQPRRARHGVGYSGGGGGVPREQACVWKAHSGAARALAFAHDGSHYLYTVGDDKALKVWDIASCTPSTCVYTGRVGGSYAGEGYGYNSGSSSSAAAGAPVAVTRMSSSGGGGSYGGGVGGRFVGSFVGGSVGSNSSSNSRLYNTAAAAAAATSSSPSLATLPRTDGHTNWVRCLAVQKRTAAAAAGGGFRYIASGGDDRGVHVWDVRTRHAVHCFYEPSAGVRGLDFHPDGNCLVSADASGTLNVYDLRMSSSSSLSLTAHTDVNTTATRTTSARKRRSFALLQHYSNAHDGAANAVSFSHDGGWLLSAGDDGAVKLWDVREGYLYCTVQAHEGAVKTCRFSNSSNSSSSGYDERNSDYFVSAGADKVVMLWRSGLPRYVARQGSAVAAAAAVVAAYDDDDNRAATTRRASTATPSSSSAARVVSFADTIDVDEYNDDDDVVVHGDDEGDNATVSAKSSGNEGSVHSKHRRTYGKKSSKDTTTATKEQRQRHDDTAAADERSFTRSEERYDSATRHGSQHANVVAAMSSSAKEQQATHDSNDDSDSNHSSVTQRLLLLERSLSTLVACVHEQQAAHARDVAALRAASEAQYAQHRDELAQLRALLTDTLPRRQQGHAPHEDTAAATITSEDAQPQSSS